MGATLQQFAWPEALQSSIWAPQWTMVTMFRTNVTINHHLISQAGWNRCNLSIYPSSMQSGTCQGMSWLHLHQPCVAGKVSYTLSLSLSAGHLACRQIQSCIMDMHGAMPAACLVLIQCVPREPNVGKIAASSTWF